MAAQSIKKLCKQKNIPCKVETQGALGIENELNKKDIEEADLIVLANDVGIQKSERFAGFEEKIFQTDPHTLVKDAGIIFRKEHENEANTE
ncbi:PTS system, Fru family, IIB component [Enterococcus pallens]|nr:PTS system, Fru family, IIB component [Enterococcus pallens]